MKKVIASLLFILSFLGQGTVLAQQGGFNLDAMTAYSNCTAKIDQSSLDALKTRSDTISSELKALCESGKRDQAKSKALAYTTDVHNSSGMKQMRQCNKLLEGSMFGSMMKSLELNMIEDYKNKHVCDNF